jgi:hypothetical protein
VEPRPARFAASGSFCHVAKSSRNTSAIAPRYAGFASTRNADASGVFFVLGQAAPRPVTVKERLARRRNRPAGDAFRIVGTLFSTVNIAVSRGTENARRPPLR